jgi:hypothetical protein
VAGSKNITKRMPVSLAAMLKIIEDVKDKFSNFSAFCAVALCVIYYGPSSLQLMCGLPEFLYCSLLLE